MGTTGSAPASPPAIASARSKTSTTSRRTAPGSIPTRPRSRSTSTRLFPDSPYRFTRFRKTHGYANQPLDGIWLRGPYLHNGSVPTLRDLLNPPAQRPAMFYRGNDVFDAVGVGFVSNVAESGGRRFTRYDTTVPGNGNMGHEYGTTLSDADKAAIVEYLKTF